MSAFTKPPNDQGNAPMGGGSGGGSGGGGGGPGKPEAQPAKPSIPQPRPMGPPIVVTRTIDVGPAQPAPKVRPPAPTVPTLPNIPPAAIPAGMSPPTTSKAPPTAATPAQKTPTLKMDPPPQSARPSSRPSAPPLVLEEGVTSIADTFERLLAADLDKGFDAIERKPGAPPTIEGMEIADLSEVRTLFAQLAANHVRPVRDFLMDLRWGEATTGWIDLCEPSLRSLRRAGDKLELIELCAALDVFSEALAATKASGARVIEGDKRAALLSAHDKLAEVMPQAFALDLDRTQRESVILQSLLAQVPDVKKVTIDKLVAAGLTTLEAMRLANPGDVAATTGIDLALATRIVQRFQEYHAQAKARVPDATHAPERGRIAELTARLKREHEQYEEASKGWTREAADRKKEARAARERTLLDIQVLLARLGEVDTSKEIERLPFDKKLAKLESFLEEARDKYVTQP